MRVSVACFGAMREYLPEGASGNRAEVEVSEGASVSDVVDGLGAPRRLVFALLVDGERAALDAPLHEGAEVTLMPPFTGGSTDDAANTPLGRERFARESRALF